MDISTCYQLLGISSNSTEKEITSAYKRRAMIFHPDKQALLSTSLEDVSFIQIRKAYEIIMTERKRQNTLNLAKQIVKEKLSNMFSQDEEEQEEQQLHFQEQQKRMNEKLSSISSTLNRWNYKPQIYKVPDKAQSQNVINLNKTQTTSIITISYEQVTINALDLSNRIKNKINIFNIVHQEFS